ncbi:MAG: hypothetical protein R3B06_14900 [Kofleriaceae bacterium]
MTRQRPRRGRAVLLALAVAGAAVAGSIALADDASDRDSYLRDIASKLSYAASELSGLKSDSDDGDARDADGYIDQVRDLVSRLDRVKGDDSKAREVADRYPGYIEKYQRASAALHSLKGSQNANITIVKACQDKNAELVAQARDFDSRNDPDGLEKLPRLASEAKNLTVRFLEEAEKARYQMESWKSTIKYFDVSDGGWADVRSALHRDADEIYDAFKSDLDTAKERCRDLTAGPDHPVVREVLGKLANSSAGRREVMDNLNRLIGEMAGKLGEVQRASGVYAVDNVREKLDAIDSALQILERTRGADPKAKAIAERWPAIAREARAAIEPLREVKLHQHDMDTLPGRCRELEAKLDSFIASTGTDAEGIDAIPAFATELGNPVIVGLAKAKERLYQMARDRDSVQRFSSSEGPWAAVTAAYKDASHYMYDEFEEMHEDTLEACQYLTKTVDHPKVRSAVDKLKATSGAAIDILTRDVNAWVAQAKATYRLDCDAMTTLWEAYCELDWEPDEDADTSKADSAASSLQRTMQDAMGPLLDKLPVLEAQATALARRRETKDRAVALSRDLAKERERLERMFPRRVWQGVNNPLKFYSAEWGKQQHRRMAASYSCDVSDQPFGGRQRPDCIKADGCIILEFKSKDDSAVTEGEKSLRDYYKPMVTRYYQEHLDRGTDPDSDHGGKAIMKAFADKGCIKDKRIAFDTAVRSYDMCERVYKCVEN